MDTDRQGSYHPHDPRNTPPPLGSAPGTPGPLDQDFSAKWIADLELSFRATHFTVGAGAHNIFDTYPEILRFENARGTATAPGAIRYGKSST